MYKYLGLILAISMLSISCASVDRTVSGVEIAAPNEYEISQLMRSLDGQEFTGSAMAYNLKEQVKNKDRKHKLLAGVLDRIDREDGRFFRKDDKFGSTDANMAFQVQDGRLYYLSKIFSSDKAVEKAGLGLCVNSPPREAVFRSDKNGNIVGDIVLPERVLFKNGKMSDVQLYKTPLLSVDLSKDKSNLSFVALPFTTITKLDIADIKVTYTMKKESTQTTRGLAEQLKACLAEKPWKSNEFKPYEKEEVDEDEEIDNFLKRWKK